MVLRFASPSSAEVQLAAASPRPETVGTAERNNNNNYENFVNGKELSRNGAIGRK